MGMSPDPENLALPTPATHAAWLAVKRQELTGLLGGFPPRTSLTINVVRRKEEADRIVELLEYESEPIHLGHLLCAAHEGPLSDGDAEEC